MGTRGLALGSAGYLCHFYRHRATFITTAPLARTEKGCARRGGAKAKINGMVAVAQK